MANPNDFMAYQTAFRNELGALLSETGVSIYIEGQAAFVEQGFVDGLSAVEAAQAFIAQAQRAA